MIKQILITGMMALVGLTGVAKADEVQTPEEAFMQQCMVPKHGYDSSEAGCRKQWGWKEAERQKVEAQKEAAAEKAKIGAPCVAWAEKSCHGFISQKKNCHTEVVCHELDGRQACRNVQECDDTYAVSCKGAPPKGSKVLHDENNSDPSNLVCVVDGQEFPARGK